MILNKRVIDCCKPDCSERMIGCHATCPRYVAQREKLEQEKALKIKTKERECDFIRYKIKHRDIADY